MNILFADIQLTILSQGKRLRVRPLEGQKSPVLCVSCPQFFRSQLPVVFIFTADLKLIQSEKRKAYFIAIKRNYQQLQMF